MARRYSLYEAKARFSAIIREVRDGHPVTVTWHGQPVAEIRPITTDREGLEGRLADLAERGVVVRPARPGPPTRAIARRQGALRRFLADRDE